MKLLATDSFVAIGDISKEEISIIKKRFTYKDMSEAMTKGGFNKRKVKTVCFAKQKGQALLLRSGFLQELIFFIKENNMSVSNFEDKRTKIITEKYTDIQLREYFNPDFDYVEHQIMALKALLKTNVGILKLPTSAGKSSVVEAFLKAVKIPTLILVNGVSLSTQLCSNLNNAGLDVGICNGRGVVKKIHMVSTIGSVKKLSLSEYECLFIDEVHGASAKTYQDFLNLTSFPYRYGLSATPDSTDKYKWASIRQHLGDIIYETGSKELIDNKVITPPKIVFKSVDCIPTPSWDSAYDKCIVKNKDRNKIVIDIIKKYDKQSLILFKIISHGEYLKEKIPNSILLSGKDSLEVRLDAIEKFKTGEIQTLIASSIFTQGISINNIELMINVSGGKSKVEVLQRLGRSLRNYEGKDYALVFDFMDNGNKYTEKHSLQREHLYRKAGFEDISYD